MIDSISQNKEINLIRKQCKECNNYKYEQIFPTSGYRAEKYYPLPSGQKIDVAILNKDNNLVAAIEFQKSEEEKKKALKNIPLVVLDIDSITDDYKWIVKHDGFRPGRCKHCINKNKYDNTSFLITGRYKNQISCNRLKNQVNVINDCLKCDYFKDLTRTNVICTGLEIRKEEKCFNIPEDAAEKIERTKNEKEEKILSYSDTVRKFKEISEIIKAYGYTEAESSPFIYTYEYKPVRFFFDMRIKKWKFSNVILYWHWLHPYLTSNFKQKAIYFEFNRLSELSFKMKFNTKEDVILIPDYEKYDICTAQKIKQELYDGYPYAKVIGFDCIALSKYINNKDLENALIEAMNIIRRNPDLSYSVFRKMDRWMRDIIHSRGETIRDYKHSSTLNRLIREETNHKVRTFLLAIRRSLKGFTCGLF